MTPVLRATLLYSLVPVVFTIIGAAGGAYWTVLARLRPYVLYLAAGVVFAVVSVELLPEIQRRALVMQVVVGFALGIGTMLAADRLIERIRGEDDDDDASPAAGFRHGGAIGAGLLLAVGIDFLLDGLLLGVGFAAGARIGILLAIAEAAEQLSVGLALAGEMRAGGVRPARVLWTVSALGLLVFVTAVLGATVLRTLSGGAMEIVLSFGAAALLYLVTEELLREAHEEKETALGTTFFFIGFLAFLVVGMTLD